MLEELGEVASALQRKKGLRPRKTETDLPGEVGRLNIDLDHEMERVWAKYDIRDGYAWKDHKPEEGR